MATWIACHNPHNAEILVNIELVRTMQTTKQQGTYLKFDDNHGITLKETSEDIVHGNPVGRR